MVSGSTGNARSCPAAMTCLVPKKRYSRSALSCASLVVFAPSLILTLSSATLAESLKPSSASADHACN